MKSNELITRWSTPAWRERAIEVAFRLVTGSSFDDLDLDKFDGRIDLRGFPFPPPDRIARFAAGSLKGLVLNGLIVLRGITWRGLDLSHGRLANLRMFSVHIDDCVFYNADCEDWRLWDTEVSRCRFARTNLRGSALGTFHDGKGNRWNGVIFDGCDFRDTTLMGSDFSGCDFVNVKFGSAWFTRCSFHDVKFVGRLREVLFDMRHIPSQPEPDPGPMTNVDFTKASFDSVEFRGAKFDGCKFPDDPGLILVPNYPPIARRQLRLLEGNESDVSVSVRALIANELNTQTADDWTEVFSRRDLVDWGGEAFADLAESTLLRAISEAEAAGWPNENLPVTTRASRPA